MVSSAVDSTSANATQQQRRLPDAQQLEDTIKRGGLVKDGSKGAPVEQAQKLLKAQGFDPGTADGKMGTNTHAAVVKFQQSRGIKVDGIVGPETLRELKTPTTGVDRRTGRDTGVQPTPQNRVPGQQGADFQRQAQLEQSRRQTTPSTPTTPATPSTNPNPTGAVTLAPKNMTEEQKFQHYSAIIKANGGQVCPDGKPTVLGIRGMDTNGNKHESTNNRKYDDTFVVLTPDHKVQELKGATHAGQLTTSLVSHVGRIEPGNYKAAPNGDHNGMPSFRVSTQSGNGNIPAVRDQNNDGHYSAAEQQRKTTADGILFHVGFTDSPKSIGCQTFPPGEMQKLLNRVGNRGFSFSLVDANR